MLIRANLQQPVHWLKVLFCKAILVSAALSFVFNSSYAQSYFRFSGNQKKVTIPYKFYRNLIIIPVMLNGKGPFNFVLDTGVGVFTITDPAIKDLLKLKLGKEIIIKGLGELDGVKAAMVGGISVSMHGIESLPMTAVIFHEDPFLLSTYLGIKVTGIVGYEFFSSFVVKINYIEKVLSIYDVAHFSPGKKYQALPIEIRSNKPFIKGSCLLESMEEIPLDLLIDTGAGFPLSLQRFSDSRLVVPEKRLETTLGLGLNGIVHGNLARTNSLTIGNYTFNQVVTSFPDFDNWGSKSESSKRNGSIGNFLLKRFNIIFDYNGSKMYIKPNSRINDSFDYDRVGIEVVGGGANYNRFIIFQVKPNSPAAEADIKPDDELVEINFQPVKNMELGNIDKILSDPKTKNIMLKVISGEEFRYIFLRMKDLI